MLTGRAFDSSGGDDSAALPTADDRFFGDPCVRQTWASAWDREHDWYHYVTGYKDAADTLFAQLEAGGRAIKLGPPIVFLYRHHLELAIKQLMRQCAALLHRDVAIPLHHRLDDLWRLCLSLLVEESPGSTAAEEVQQTTRLIDEFCRVDRTSAAFRYPEDKAGNPSLSGVGEMSLAQIRDVVGKVSLLLECISTELSSHE